MKPLPPFSYVVIIKRVSFTHDETKKRRRKPEMISFEPMRKLMKEKGITQYQLLKDGVLLPAYVTRLSCNHNFTLKFIDKLCRELDCQPGDLIEYVASENNTFNQHAN
jgi:DNA-binding Xre family transcriptional regulator